MAGHSKWANIKYRKAQQDAKKVKSFTKLIREIVVAAKLGGPDLANNPRLRIAIDKALSQNMTRDTIQRAVQRAVNPQNNDNMETVLYEGYGPEGSAFLIECVTDNRNRSISDVRSSFTKLNASLAVSGAVQFLFRYVGQITLPSLPQEEALFSLLEDELIVDVIVENEACSWSGQPGVIYTTSSGLYIVENFLKNLNYKVDECTLLWQPKNVISLSKESQIIFDKLLDKLSSLEDVQEIYHNVEEANI